MVFVTDIYSSFQSFSILHSIQKPQVQTLSISIEMTLSIFHGTSHPLPCNTTPLPPAHIPPDVSVMSQRRVSRKLETTRSTQFELNKGTCKIKLTLLSFNSIQAQKNLYLVQKTSKGQAGDCRGSLARKWRFIHRSIDS